MIMTETEFYNQYWKQYIMIEKEFKVSVKYVAIDKLSFAAYSDVYAKLLLQIGSEVDVVAKILCREINQLSTADKINQYQKEICSRFSEYSTVTVACGDIDLKPWSGWSHATPEWWSIYNGVKHNRNKIESHGNISMENYKFANQENVLNALAGLYQLEQYLYTIINHDPHIETPLPGSRLYKLKDQGWENKFFGQDTFFYVDNGELYTVFADIPYTDM